MDAPKLSDGISLYCLVNRGFFDPLLTEEQRFALMAKRVAQSRMPKRFFDASMEHLTGTAADLALAKRDHIDSFVLAGDKAEYILTAKKTDDALFCAAAISMELIKVGLMPLFITADELLRASFDRDPILVFDEWPLFAWSKRTPLLVLYGLSDKTANTSEVYTLLLERHNSCLASFICSGQPEPGTTLPTFLGITSLVMLDHIKAYFKPVDCTDCRKDA